MREFLINGFKYHVRAWEPDARITPEQPGIPKDNCDDNLQARGLRFRYSDSHTSPKRAMQDLSMAFSHRETSNPSWENYEAEATLRKRLLIQRGTRAVNVSG